MHGTPVINLRESKNLRQFIMSSPAEVKHQLDISLDVTPEGLQQAQEIFKKETAPNIHSLIFKFSERSSMEAKLTNLKSILEACASAKPQIVKYWQPPNYWDLYTLLIFAEYLDCRNKSFKVHLENVDEHQLFVAFRAKSEKTSFFKLVDSIQLRLRHRGAFDPMFLELRDVFEASPNLSIKLERKISVDESKFLAELRQRGVEIEGE
jgi:hypothetical protein